MRFIITLALFAATVVVAAPVSQDNQEMARDIDYDPESPGAKYLAHSGVDSALIEFMENYGYFKK